MIFQTWELKQAPLHSNRQDENPLKNPEVLIQILVMGKHRSKTSYDLEQEIKWE